MQKAKFSILFLNPNLRYLAHKAEEQWIETTLSLAKSYRDLGDIEKYQSLLQELERARQLSHQSSVNFFNLKPMALLSQRAFATSRVSSGADFSSKI